MKTKNYQDVNFESPDRPSLSAGLGTVVDSGGKAKTAYIVEKQYTVHNIYWYTLWSGCLTRQLNKEGMPMKKEDQQIEPSLMQEIIYNKKFNFGIDDFRILHALMDQAKLGNVFTYTQTKLADDLGIAKSRIWRSFKKLREAEIIYPLDEFNERGFYITAKLGYKGELKLGNELRKLPIQQQAEMSIRYLYGVYTTKKLKR